MRVPFLTQCHTSNRRPGSHARRRTKGRRVVLAFDERRARSRLEFQARLHGVTGSRRPINPGAYRTHVGISSCDGIVVNRNGAAFEEATHYDSEPIRPAQTAWQRLINARQSPVLTEFQYPAARRCAPIPTGKNDSDSLSGRADLGRIEFLPPGSTADRGDDGWTSFVPAVKAGPQRRQESSTRPWERSLRKKIPGRMNGS
jgi:hypothetical protein